MVLGALMKVVIRIGGSVIASPPNVELIKEYSEMLQNLRGEGYELAVIVGGGFQVREFIEIAKDLSLEEEAQDEIAISVSRLLVQLLAMKMGGPEWKQIPTSLDEAVKVFRRRGIIVMGGLKPGMTTDTVAALVAAKVSSNLIVKATDQEGIYTKDPKKYPDAKKLDEISLKELSELLEENKHKAGIHQIVDPEAIRVLKEKHIKMIVVNGFKPENVNATIKGKKIGTVIQ